MNFIRFVLLVIAVAVAAPSASQGPGSAHVYVTVTDAKGVPMAGLVAADFAIRVDGKDVKVLEAAPATEPVALVLLTEGIPIELTSDLRRTMRALVALLGKHDLRSRIGLMLNPGPAAPVMHRVTNEAAELDKEISQFVGSHPTAPLLEGILVASKTLRGEPSKRRVVLAIAAGDDSNHDVAAPSQVVQELRESGVSVWALDLGWGAKALSLSEARILADATRMSGGKQEFSTSMTLSPAVTRILDAIHSQYLLTYDVPDGLSGSKTLGVGVRRPGVSVLAPTWTRYLDRSGT